MLAQRFADDIEPASRSPEPASTKNRAVSAKAVRGKSAKAAEKK
jgi:hypothetical protein